MATIMGEIRDHEKTALLFKPGGSHIQIDSLSIEISSGEINGSAEECKHFSIRGFVREQRKKDRRLCSPFISDGDTISSSSSMELDLPPLDVHKFKWWRCSGCLQGCNSLQGEGTNCKQEIAMCLRQQKGSLCKSKAGQIRSVAKGKQLVVEEEEEEEEEEEPLKNIANQGKVRLLIHDYDHSQVCRHLKSSSRKSRSNKLCSSSSKVVMGPPPPSLPPPRCFINARTSTPPSKSLSKQHNKSAASSSPQSSNLLAGRAIFSNLNHSSQTRLQPLIIPLSSKKQDVHIPKPNG